MARRVEVGFNPHGASEWPHFLATVEDPVEIETLYELGPDGWRATFRAGGRGGFATGDVPLQDAALEDLFWKGAAALTDHPEVVAIVCRDGDTWEPWDV